MAAAPPPEKPEKKAASGRSRPAAKSKAKREQTPNAPPKPADAGDTSFEPGDLNPGDIIPPADTPDGVPLSGPPPDATKSEPSGRRRQRTGLSDVEEVLRASDDASKEGSGTPAPWTRLAMESGAVDIRALDVLPEKRSSVAPGMSRNLVALLKRAADVSTCREADGFAWVDEESIWRALFSPGLETEEWENSTNILVVAQQTFDSLTNGAAKTDVDVTPAVDAALTSGVLDVLAASEGIIEAVSSRGDRFVTARHFLFALMGSESGQSAFVSVNRLPESVGGNAETLIAFWKDFVDPLGENVLGQLYRERKTSWKKVIADVVDNPPEPSVKSRITPDYLADSRVALPTLVDDPLGAVRDAAAMAELICLEAASPPLAVGLFGNWGSGKTTFMQIMQREIDSIAADAATRRHKGDDLPFVENVVHVWFNAWTFADKGNLWASIAMELFRQLSVGGWSGREKAVTTQWLGAVREAVRTGGSNVSEKQQELQKIEDDLQDKRRKKEQIEAELSDAASTGLTDRIAGALDRVTLSDSPGVKRAMEELGVPTEGPQPKATEVVATLRNLKGLSGEITALRRSLFVGQHVVRNWIIFVVIAALGTGAGVLMVQAFGWGVWGYAGAIAVGLGGWIGRSIQMINKVLAPLAGAESEIEEQHRQALGSIHNQIIELEADRKKARKALDTSREEAASLDALIKGEDERLLAYFIRERWETGGWREHLGVVAMVQEAIEELSVLLRTEGEEFNRKRAEAQEAGKTFNDKAPIQRIVLYIDDLDRCHPKQVAEVLQAVHLLLAYPVFVVVVGVDPDWLSTALVEVYPNQIGLGQPDKASSEERGSQGPEPHATVSDYLEKIFQIPYWLRPLSDANDDRYRLLVNRMIGRDPSVLPQAAAPADKDDSARQEADEKAGKATFVDLTRFVLTDRKPPPPPVVDRDSADIWEGVQLTDPEVALMEKLGPLAGKSPRAVKRFVNLYRLIRTREQGNPDFLNGAPPVWPAAMFLLALEIGQPVHRQREFSEVWRGVEVDTYIVGIANFWTEFNDVPDDVEKRRQDILWSEVLLPTLTELGTANTDLQAKHLLPNSPAARAVSRFSIGRLSD